VPVVAQMTAIAFELLRLPADVVHAETVRPTAGPTRRQLEFGSGPSARLRRVVTSVQARCGASTRHGYSCNRDLRRASPEEAANRKSEINFTAAGLRLSGGRWRGL
jgi:hypothetical protein